MTYNFKLFNNVMNRLINIYKNIQMNALQYLKINEKINQTMKRIVFERPRPEVLADKDDHMKKLTFSSLT